MSQRVSQPDLTVRVHLRRTVDVVERADVAEVAVGVATGSGLEPSRTRRVDGAHRAVDRLGPQQGVERELAHHDVAHGAGVRLVALLVQEVLRVPVAPGLTHRTGLLVVEAAVAVGVDHQTVREPVRVFVIHDLGVVPAVRGRDPAEPEGRHLAEQVHLHRRGEPVGRRRHVRVVDVVQVGQPVIGVGAVRGVAQHHVVAVGAAVLEVAGVVVEADRARGQVIVELIQEEEDLDGVVRQLILPALGDLPLPGARTLRAAVLSRPRRVQEAARVVVEQEARTGVATGGHDRVAGVGEAVVLHVLEHPGVRPQELGAGLADGERVRGEDVAEVHVVDGHAAAVGRDRAVVEGPHLIAGGVGRGGRAGVRHVAAVQDLPRRRVDERQVHLRGRHVRHRAEREARAATGREEGQVGFIAGVSGNRAHARARCRDRLRPADPRSHRWRLQTAHRAAGHVDEPAVRRDARANALAEEGEAARPLHVRQVVGATDVHVVLAQVQGPQVRVAESERIEVGSDVVEHDRGRRSRAGPGEEPVEAPDESQRPGGGIAREDPHAAQRPCQRRAGHRGPCRDARRRRLRPDVERRVGGCAARLGDTTRCRDRR